MRGCTCEYCVPERTKIALKLWKDLGKPGGKAGVDIIYAALLKAEKR